MEKNNNTLSFKVGQCYKITINQIETHWLFLRKEDGAALRIFDKAIFTVLFSEFQDEFEEEYIEILLNNNVYYTYVPPDHLKYFSEVC